MRPAPAPAGDSLLVSRFLPTREQSINRIILHRTTTAKTRATATLRQRHIPPNVRVNSGPHSIQWVNCPKHNKGCLYPLSLRSVSPSRRHLEEKKTNSSTFCIHADSAITHQLGCTPPLHWMRSGLLRIQGNLFICTQVRSFSYKSKRPLLSLTGRYMALPFPHRENFLAKEDC